MTMYSHLELMGMGKGRSVIEESGAVIIHNDQGDFLQRAVTCGWSWVS